MHTITDELALINMQAREYDPSLALFLQPDPLQEQGDPHPYAYANHNPLKYIDPTGTSYVNPFGGSPGYNYGTGFDMGSRSTCITCYSDGKTVNWNSQQNNAYSYYNSSSPLGAFGSPGTALTNLNTPSAPHPQNTVGAGRSTGTPVQPSQPSQPASSPSNSFSDILSHLSGSIGGGGAVQLGFLGANVSGGVTGSGSGNWCLYASGCGRVGFGLLAGGGLEGSGKIGRPLENGVDFSTSYYSSGVKMGLFSDSTVGLDQLEYSKELFGGGWGIGAVGYQGCATVYFGCR